MLLIDKYAYFNRLKHIHPVEKVTLALSLLFFSLIVKDLLVSISIFTLMSGLIVFAAKIPMRYYLKLLLLPSFFLLSGIVTILISIAGIDTAIPNLLWTTSVGGWKLYITRENVSRTADLIFVTFSSISCLYFLILTTPVHAILIVLRKLKLPKLLIEMMEITYRFIFVLLENASQIYQAQHSRLGYRTGKQGLYSIGLLISALFMVVFKRSKELTHAMESRAYTNDIHDAGDDYPISAASWLMIFTTLAGIFVIYMV